MILNYQDIYSRFLAKITDYDFLKRSTDDSYEYMCSWLHSAMSKPYVRRKFQTFKMNDEVMNLTFELRNSVDEDSDYEFVTEIAALGMVVEWLAPRVQSTNNVNQIYSGKEQKFYSQSNHMQTVNDLWNTTKNTVRKMIRDYGYINNSYINRD